MLATDLSSPKDTPAGALLVFVPRLAAGVVTGMEGMLIAAVEMAFLVVLIFYSNSVETAALVEYNHKEVGSSIAIKHHYRV